MSGPKTILSTAPSVVGVLAVDGPLLTATRLLGYVLVSPPPLLIETSRYPLRPFPSESVPLLGQLATSTHSL